MDFIVLLIIVILLVLVGWAALRKLRREAQTFSRVYRAADEHGLDPTGFKPGDVLAFSGRRSFTTEPFPLEPGEYRLRYWFSAAVPVQVELASPTHGEREVILIKSGEGEVSFAVDAGGRYLFIVEPADDESEWEIEVSRLGLPSGHQPQSM